jgi:hypothetical protein
MTESKSKAAKKDKDMICRLHHPRIVGAKVCRVCDNQY